MRASSWASRRALRLMAFVELRAAGRAAGAARSSGSDVVADVLDQLLDVGVARVDVGALVDAGQEGRLPVLRLLDRVAAGTHGDEAGQVLVLGAQAVGHPRAEARPRQAGLAAVHQHQRRLVIRHVGVHRADDAHVVGMLRRRLGKSSLTSMPLLPYFANLKGDANAAPVLRSVRRLFGSGLPCVLVERRLGVEGVDVAGPPFMNRWMTRFALAGKCGVRGASGSRRAVGVTAAAGVAEQPGEAERGHAHAGAARRSRRVRRSGSSLTVFTSSLDRAWSAASVVRRSGCAIRLSGGPLGENRLVVNGFAASVVFTTTLGTGATAPESLVPILRHENQRRWLVAAGALHRLSHYETSAAFFRRMSSATRIHLARINRNKPRPTRLIILNTMS